MDGKTIGDTLERPWVFNQRNVSSIPSGTYGARLKIRPSGKLAIELLNVPGRTHILIHPANIPSELEGCIAPGKTAGNDSVGRSREAMREILDIIDLVQRVDAATGDVTDIVVNIR